MVAELQTNVGDFKAATQGHGEDPVPAVLTPFSLPAGEVVRIVKVRQGGDIAVKFDASDGAAGVDRDAVGGVDELGQTVARTAVWVVAGIVRRSPTQWDVGQRGE